MQPNKFQSWREQKSSNGRNYYYNTTTEVSQWSKPTEWQEYEDKLKEQSRLEWDRDMQAPVVMPPPNFPPPQTFPPPPPPFQFFPPHRCWAINTLRMSIIPIQLHRRSFPRRPQLISSPYQHCRSRNPIAASTMSMLEPSPPIQKSRMLSVDEMAEEEKMLRQFPCYHGFLAREDIPDLLKKEGDYLLRVSEKDPVKNVQVQADIKKDIIISVHVGSRSLIQDPTKPTKEDLSMNTEGPQKSTAAPAPQTPNAKSEKPVIKHVIVSRKTTGYAVESNHPFPTMGDLIAYYSKNYGYLVKNKFILKQPIDLQNWEHLHKDILIDQLLGEGAFGEVRRGVLTKRWNRKKVDVAIKLLKGTAGITVGKDKIKEMMNEARLMRNFKHRNVVRMYGVAVHEQPIYIILELIRGGGLDSYLKKNAGHITNTEKINMAYGAALGVEYLHKNKCIHRDLAARNCLYTEDKIIKISDFGLSKNAIHYVVKSPTRLPTKWLAPETLAWRYFNLKTDVYSYGVLLYEVFSDGGDPWAETTTMDVKKALKDGKFLVLPGDAPDRLKVYVHEKIFTTEHKRATMTEVCNFFTKHLVAELDKTMFSAELKANAPPPNPPSNQPPNQPRRNKSAVQLKPFSLTFLPFPSAKPTKN